MKLAAFLFLLHALPAFANELPFVIGGGLAGYNSAFVTLTICEDQTDHCAVVDRILLDTGSNGLRISKKALAGLKFAEIRPGDYQVNEHLMTCSSMAGRVGYWGTLAKATVLMGDSPAKGVQIQVVDPSPAAGTPCLNGISETQNGILGIGTALLAPQFSQTSFRCSGKICSVTPNITGFGATNPIAHLLKDNNGFIVRLPSVQGPVDKVSGRLIFGIGTKANNRTRRGLSICRPNAKDFFQVRFKGRRFWTKLDTGTPSILMSKTQTEFSLCPLAHYQLCPETPQQVKLEILNANGSVCRRTNVQIRAYDYRTEMWTNGNWVYPEMVSIDGRVDSDLPIIGLPFFFGRDVFFGLDGQKSSIAVGPYVAF